MIRSYVTMRVASHFRHRWIPIVEWFTSILPSNDATYMEHAMYHRSPDVTNLFYCATCACRSTVATRVIICQRDIVIARKSRRRCVSVQQIYFMPCWFKSLSSIDPIRSLAVTLAAAAGCICEPTHFLNSLSWKRAGLDENLRLSYKSRRAFINPDAMRVKFLYTFRTVNTFNYKYFTTYCIII